MTEGTIEVRDNPNQDLSGLSRDTETALNKLDKIFDKKTAQEQQELAQLFGEIAYEEIHKLAEREGLKAAAKLTEAKLRNAPPEEQAALKAQIEAWKEGGDKKIILHALVGGMMAGLGGGDILSGAAGAGANEALQKNCRR